MHTRFTLLVASLLFAPSMAQAQRTEPAGQANTAGRADFSGTWRTSATVRRADSVQVGTRLQGVAKYTQVESRVSGTTSLGGPESQVTGNVYGSTLRLDARGVDPACPSHFQAQITMSSSGDLFTGWFAGENCNGFLEATLVGRRGESRRGRQGSSLVEVLEEAEALLLGGAHEDAVRSFREARKRADQPSYRIQIGLARSYNRVGAFKDSQVAALDAVQIAPGPEEVSDAYFELGVARLAGSKDQPDRLAEAEQAFRRSLELSEGRINMARYRLGQVLLKLERDAEGAAVLSDFVRADPDSPMVPQAEALIKNPRRARELLIPDFEMVTLDGRYLETEDFQNQVVLVDFWGTWCFPCLKALPGLKRLSHKLASDPFVILSVSSDTDEALLRKFIEDNDMRWPQTWDKERGLAQLFEVQSWPTYLLFDQDGAFVFRHSGWSARGEAQLNNRITKTVKSAKKALAQ